MRNREMVLTIIHRSNNRCVCMCSMCNNEPSPKWETTWNILAAHHRISFSDKLLIAWIRNLILIYGVHSMPVWWFQSFRFRFCLGAFRLFVSFNLYFKRSNPIRSDPMMEMIVGGFYITNEAHFPYRTIWLMYGILVCIVLPVIVFHGERRWVFNGKSFINVMFRCSNIDHLNGAKCDGTTMTTTTKWRQTHIVYYV